MASVCLQNRRVLGLSRTALPFAPETAGAPWALITGLIRNQRLALLCWKCLGHGEQPCASQLHGVAARLHFACSLGNALC